MPIKQIVPDVYAISLGVVNTFLIDADGLTLIDTGAPGSADRILAAVGELGRQPTDIRNIVVTHCHVDHAGSLAALKQATGATAWMHPDDAALVEAGQAVRPFTTGPGLLNSVLFQLFIKNIPPTVEPATIERRVGDGEELPLAGGLRAVHVPGHCAGQLALLWPRHGGVLFAADTVSHMLGLQWSIVYEDFELGKRSLRKLADLEFAVACFGHGRAISSGAAEQFRRFVR